MGTEDTWNDMLNEFRALGGTAENIRLAQGPFGRGLFPIDSNKPVRISIPDDLLVLLEDIYFEEEVFRVNSRSPVSSRGRRFLEEYERAFAWGAARGEVERLLTTLLELPESVRELATRTLGLGRFFLPISQPLLQKWFFETRSINSAGRNVIMPIIELANHGGAACYRTPPGVELSGTFDGEVLVRYTVPTDPYDMFLNWMFAPSEPIAFSMAIQGTQAGRRFDIRRDFNHEGPPFVPKVSLEEDRIVLSYLLLGNRQLPRVPRGAFHKALESLRIEHLDEIYDYIQMVNRRMFLELLDVLQGVDSPGATLLRTLAINQLAALSVHYGFRRL